MPPQRPQPTKKPGPTEMLPPPLPPKKILENEVAALSNCFRVREAPLVTPPTRTELAHRAQWSTRHRFTDSTTKPDACEYVHCDQGDDWTSLPHPQ